jgi:hypothetical protein
MKNFPAEITKKIVLFVSSVYVFSLFFFFGCYDSVCGNFAGGLLTLFMVLLSPLIPIFLLSLIMIGMRVEIFLYWSKFAIWMVPLIIAFLAWICAGRYGGGIEDATRAFFTIVIAMSSLVIFFLASLVIIIWKWFSLKKASKTTKPL